jgi:hypothetical protein
MMARLDLQGAGVFWTATGLAGLSLVLVLVNALLARSNESARLEVNQRQLSINEWTLEQRQNQDLIQMLAVASARDNDAAIRDLLAKNGVTFTVNQPAPGAGEGVAAPGTPPAPANPPQRKP